MHTLIEEPVAPSAAPSRPSPWRRLVRGRTDDPAWVRPALLVLLAGTAALYLWNLGASGWANAYYSAAVQAATESWKAFFFGSFDSSNFVTVDKTPASLWVMAVSARIFGINAWSILVPQALMGVASVGVVYAAVRRVSTPVAGLIAGVVLALTPVATLMFRFNNPDALLTLLLVAAAYSFTRAIERAHTGWLTVSGALVGFAFLAKMLQAFIVLPVFGLVYLFCAPTPVRRRILQLLGFASATIVSAGWWVAAVTWWPASSRPYIGGSQTNSVIELMFSYNGLGRLTGNEPGSVGGGPPGAGGRWGAFGLTRLFDASNGGQIAWLVPAALILLAAVIVVTRRVSRTNTHRAALMMWGGWLVITGLVFSLAQGIFHEYYSVVLAPAIGAVVGMGAAAMWRRRDAIGRGVLAATLAISTVWAFTLLGRSPTWMPGLRALLLLAGLTVSGALLAPRVAAKAGAVVAGAGLVVAVAGPAAYSLETASTPHTGAIPTAGPIVQGARGGPGGMARFRMPGGDGGPPVQDGRTVRDGTTIPDGGVADGRGDGMQLPAPPPLNGRGGLRVGRPQFGGSDGIQQAPASGGAPGARGGLGGLLDAREPDEELVTLLQSAAGSRWAAATIGANSAAGVQLASGEPIMAIGGFNGTDPTPSLERFKQFVADGMVHYFLAGGMGGPGGRSFGRGGSQASSEISSWVQENFTSRTIGGVTVYDLAPDSSAGAAAV